MQLENALYQYISNVTPEMIESLGEQLGLDDLTPLKSMGLGFNFVNGCWVIPERSADGEIIGLSYRNHYKGWKSFRKGGHRGYTFIPKGNLVVGPRRYTCGAGKTVRVSEDYPCPICGRTDWCLISSDNLSNPSAVICPRTEAGSVKNLGIAGYLHIRHKQDTEPEEENGPIVITEGFSDWAVFSSLGFDTFGKPSCSFQLDSLAPLLATRKVIIVGDNDPDEAGKRGMEASFQQLRFKCPNIVKVLPPSGIKDARQWYNIEKFSFSSFLKYCEQNGDASAEDNTLNDISPLTVATAWLRAEKTLRGVSTVRNYKGGWLQFEDGCYREYPEEQLKADLYNFLEDKQHCVRDKDGNIVKIVNVAPNRSLIINVIDSLLAKCVVAQDPPYFMDGWESHREPSDLVVFNNGVLDIGDYECGDATLIPHSASYFNMSMIPHNFDTSTEPVDIISYFRQIFNDDEEKLALLQEWFGYNLVPDQSYEAIMMFVGMPRSGKGTTLDIMTAMLGKRQTAMTTMKDLCGRFEFDSLMGKLSAQIRDASMSKRSADPTVALETIKTITGGDPVSVDRKFKTKLSNVKLSCRFTLAVNDLPELPDNSRALESRLHFLSFPNSYVGKEDRGLKRRLTRNEEAMQGLLNWSLEGLIRLHENGRFTRPSSSEQLFDEFRALTSPVSEFIEECCDIGSYQDAMEDVYKCWRQWATANGLYLGKRSQLSRNLSALKSDFGISRIVDGDNIISTYKGFKLKTSARRNYLGE